MSIDFAETFNNIVTPVSSIIAIVIYAAALRTTRKQNQIILSQNIKPYFDTRINELYNEAKEKKIDFESDGVYSVLDYAKFVTNLVMKMIKNEDYLDDLGEIYKGGKVVDREYFYGRSYYNELVELNGVIIGHPATWMFDRVLAILDEIDNSKLLEEDKIYLSKRLKQTFMDGYLSYVSFLDNHVSFGPPVPFILSFDGNIEYVKLNECEGFRKHFDLFNKRSQPHNGLKIQSK